MTQASLPQSPSPIKLTILQMGDYADAFERFAAGGEETYYAQKYTVDFVGALAATDGVDKVTIISAEKYAPERTMANGVNTVGIELFPEAEKPRYQALCQLLDQIETSHLVIAMPLLPILQWALGKDLKILPLLADSFADKGLRQWLRHKRLARLLNDPRIGFVANHNIAASLDLQRIGVHADKILPFDWPAELSPEDYPPKEAIDRSSPLRLLYVGAISQAKGAGDAIEAVAALTGDQIDCQLSLIGGGEIENFRAMAARKGLGDRVEFAGLLSHPQVITAMRQADIVLVPSRPEYPEGLPMTLYEAMCVRTPLVTSDHPMFKLRIRDGENALIFKAGDATAMAAAIRRLMEQPGLYPRISQQQAAAADGYLCPLKWHDLLSGFLATDTAALLQPYALGRRAYLSET